MKLQRTATFEREQAKEDNGDYIVSMAFASELPYERWWG